MPLSSPATLPVWKSQQNAWKWAASRRAYAWFIWGVAARIPNADPRKARWAFASVLRATARVVAQDCKARDGMTLP